MKQSLAGGSFTGVYSQEKGRVLHKVSLALGGGKRIGRTCVPGWHFFLTPGQLFPDPCELQWKSFGWCSN